MRLIAIPVTFALGTILSRIMLAHTPGRFATDLAQPIPVATNWSMFGLLLWIVLATTIGVVAFVCAREYARETPAALSAIVVVCAVTLCIGIFWLPLFSSDVYAYAAYGAMADIGLNPYVHHLLPHEEVFRAALWQWSGNLPVCVYGEGFVLVAQGIVHLSHIVGVQLGLFRILACFCLVACTILAYAIAGDDKAARRRAALFIGCNPFALWAAIEGHNDVLAIAVIFVGFALLRYARALGTAIVTLAALVKLPALASALALSITSLRTRTDSKRTIAGLFAGLCVVALASTTFISGILTDFAPNTHYVPLASVQSLGIPIALAASILVALRWLAFTHEIERWTIVAFALWIAIPNPYPWYALWIVALGAFSRDHRITTTVFTVSGASLLRYIPDAAAVPTGLESTALGLLALAAFAPLFLPQTLLQPVRSGDIISRL
jgi:hypothetical protein